MSIVMLRTSMHKILRYAQHMLLAQSARMFQQDNPGLNIGVFGRGQITLGAVELLFGVDAQPRHHALSGRRHLRSRRLHRQFVDTVTVSTSPGPTRYTLSRTCLSSAGLGRDGTGRGRRASIRAGVRV